MPDDSRRDWVNHRVACIMNATIPGSRREPLLVWWRKLGETLRAWFTAGSDTNSPGVDGLDDESLSSIDARSSLTDDDDGWQALFQDDPMDNGINPATGLPMMGSLDVEGNPYGFDVHTQDDHSESDAGHHGFDE